MWLPGGLWDVLLLRGTQLRTQLKILKLQYYQKDHNGNEMYVILLQVENIIQLHMKVEQHYIEWEEKMVVFGV